MTGTARGKEEEEPVAIKHNYFRMYSIQSCPMSLASAGLCMTTWNTVFTKYQLKLNLMKTEVMVINRTP